MTRKVLSVLFVLAWVWNISNAQILKPVKWSFDAQHIEGNQYDLIYKAKIDDGWTIYSQYLEGDDGPVRTSIFVEEPANLKTIGKIKESSPKKKEGFDALFEMNVIKFAKSATFTQRVEVDDYKTPIIGYLEFMACDAEKCLPPSEVDFTFELPEPKKAAEPVKPAPPTTKPAPTPTPAPKPEPTKPEPVKADPPKSASSTTTSSTTTSAPEPKKETLVEDKKEETATEEKEDETAEAEASTDVVEEGAASSNSGSGILEPVKWFVSHKKTGEGEYEITYHARIEDGWNTYSQYLESDDGPVRTSFVYDDEANKDNFELVGKNEEVSDYKTEGMDPLFEMNVIKYKKEVNFIQKLKAKDASIPLAGYLEFMACDAEKCLPPAEVDFKLDLSNDAENIALGEEANAGGSGAVEGDFVVGGAGTPIEEKFDMSRFTSDCSGVVEKEEARTHWQTFIKGIIGGLIALLTPCVFPMIPLTVSYFLKGGKDKKKGFRDAFIYGLSIVVLYTGLGTLVTAAFGAGALNAMASNAWFNLFLAVLLVVFALSFFGYFEIQLPSKWADKTDAVADKGGLIGILGMAATLAIVSFSCTGPLIGVLLVDAVSQTGSSTGIPVGPIVGMLGFSLALALPFGLFAAFPSWLSSLPKSGGWMDDVKVSVGFLEIALSLKFLAVFSIIMEKTLGFKVLPYEAFVAIWVLVSILWALYFFQLFKFKKDPYDTGEKKKVPMVKIILGVLMLGIAGWNMMGFKTSELGTFKPTSLMSGLAPPSCHSYIKPCDCPQNLNCYKDYYEAKKVAKAENKPLMIDFTGHSCENCRKNEEDVWPEEGIIEKLRDDYIVVSLYVDETELLPAKYVSEKFGRARKIGHKWTDFQITHMGSNTQPLYVLVHINDDDSATILNKPMGNLIRDSKKFEDFLQCGLDVHAELSK